MKLVHSLRILSVSLLILVQVTCPPVYETPTIVRHDNPMNQPYNPRLDNLNDSSADNYVRYKDRQKKVGLYSELVRNFNIQSLRKWLEFFENENLHELSMPEMVDNVSRMTGKAVDLQNFISFKSGLVAKFMGLLDMKLKQIAVLDDAIKNIERHGFDIHTNLGNNLVWKQNLEELMDLSTAVNSNYSLAWGSMCEVIEQKDKINTTLLDSRRSVKHSLEKEYVPGAKYFKTVTGINKAEDHKHLPTPSVRNAKDLAKGKALLNLEKPKVNATKTPNITPNASTPNATTAVPVQVPVTPPSLATKITLIEKAEKSEGRHHKKAHLKKHKKRF